MPILTYDQIVNNLMALGVSRPAAEARARKECNVSDAAHAAEIARQESILEKEEQSEIVKAAKALGFAVYNLSQARKTKQTPGLADLWLVHTCIPLAFWWETKRQVGGERTEDQVTFGDRCLAAGIGYGFGDRFHFHDHLIHYGVAKGGPWPPEPGPLLRGARQVVG